MAGKWGCFGGKTVGPNCGKGFHHRFRHVPYHGRLWCFATAGDRKRRTGGYLTQVDKALYPAKKRSKNRVKKAVV